MTKIRRAIRNGKVLFEVHLPTDVAYELERIAKAKAILPRDVLETIVTNSLNASAMAGDRPSDHVSK